MLRAVWQYARQNAVAFLALFVALGGTGAYAINEWNGSNIQDETLTGADVRGKNPTATTAGVNGALTGTDISGQPARPSVGQPYANGSLTTWDVADNTLRSRDIGNDSLTGGDIDESTLALTRPIYARIGPDGTVEYESYKGITQSMVYKPQGTNGIYCFKDLPFMPKTGMAAASSAWTNAGVIVAASGGWPSDCARGDVAKVELRTIIGDQHLVDTYFTVWFTD